MNERAQAMERRLEKPILLAALLTIPAIAIDQSDTSPTLGALATALNWTVWVAFLAEAVLMLRVVDDRWRWIRDHPLEVAIVLLTPPFLPASMQAARAFRLLSLLRVLRLALLTRRYLSTEGVRDAAVLAAMTVLAGGAAYADVEKSQDLSVWDGVWWAVVTVTTVGYGDSYPRTDGGRIIAIVVMFVGIGFIAVLTAALAGRFLGAREPAGGDLATIEDRLEEVLRRLDAIERR